MKTRNLYLGIILISLGFISCKDEKEVQAEKNVDNYVIYVDSIEKVAIEDAQNNWEGIDAVYQLRMNEAEANLANLKDSIKAQERIIASKNKYEVIRTKMAVKTVVTPAVTSKQRLRNALFGEGKIGDDMSFAWVDAGNIHGVYQTFIHTAEDNKDSYTREDWDEIKLMYEALDSRKNTVEKEGLTKNDNRKIAALKFKFAPMIKVNRMGAKSEEMKDAKE
ncbi:hypothetical protein [Flavobacterium franklandianum]|uniref:Lipoprotein n=1 Tax=Flavobacterium franklandianum TaxID=2594430 RepID=A0A553C708_9FLAO|nr:hypothetical protein [Flavobacterium franklandianum]TRX16295.1 hypothetical protein FNW17_14370 [Flavobacterium franklandianum]